MEWKEGNGKERQMKGGKGGRNGGGGEGGGRRGRHLLRGGILDHRQKFFYVRRAAKLTLPPAPQTLAPPLGGRGRKWKGCPIKLKSWGRHWPQWPKAKKKGRLFAIRYRNPTRSRTVRALFTR
jgi:hypothetical protein